MSVFQICLLFVYTYLEYTSILLRGVSVKLWSFCWRSFCFSSVRYYLIDNFFWCRQKLQVILFDNWLSQCYWFQGYMVFHVGPLFIISTNYGLTVNTWQLAKTITNNFFWQFAKTIKNKNDYLESTVFRYQE